MATIYNDCRYAPATDLLPHMAVELPFKSVHVSLNGRKNFSHPSGEYLHNAINKVHIYNNSKPLYIASEHLLHEQCISTSNKRGHYRAHNAETKLIETVRKQQREGLTGRSQVNVIMSTRCMFVRHQCIFAYLMLRQVIHQIRRACLTSAFSGITNIKASMNTAVRS